MNDSAAPQHPGSAPESNTSPTSPRPYQEVLRNVLTAVASPTEELRDALSSGEEALIAFDAGRTILCANLRGERFFGYGAGELDGRSTDILIPARLRQPDAPPMAETTDLMQVELPGLMCDGTERPIEWCFGSARRGESVIFVMTVRDRTRSRSGRPAPEGERAALPALRQRRARLRHLHARRGRSRIELERGRGAHQGLECRGGHRSAIRRLLQRRRIAPPDCRPSCLAGRSRRGVIKHDRLAHAKGRVAILGGGIAHRAPRRQGPGPKASPRSRAI